MTISARELVFRCLEFRRRRAPRHLWCVPYISEFRKAELEQMANEFPDDVVCPGAFIPPDERYCAKGPVPNSYVDDWGCLWLQGEPGVTGEVKEPMFADWSGLPAYRAPWSRLKNARWQEVSQQQDQNLAGPNPKFLLGWSSARPFERMQFMRGTENVLMDLAYGTAEVRRLLDLIHEYYLAELEGWCKTPVDGVVFMDDWGSQRSLLISPAMWREIFKPIYKTYCDMLHAAGKKVFFHSDGNIQSIFGDLVELGMDAINSQLFVMDIEELARLYKGRTSFWGELDRQQIMPFGSPQDIRNAVFRVRNAIDDGNGGAWASFEWGAVVPLQNIRAAFQAWLDPVPTR